MEYWSLGGSGPSSVEQLQAGLGAAGFRLDDAEKGALDELTAWREA